MEESLRNNEDLKKSYQETIEDFEIEFNNTGLFEFKYRDILRKEITHYENLLSELVKKERQ